MSTGKVTYLVVGEAPGAVEDRYNKPFIGTAGNLMRSVVSTAGINPSHVGYCNVVSCRPPNNRKPTLDEIDSCEVNLKAQIAVADPTVLILAGSTALNAFRDDLKVTHTRGRPLFLTPGRVALVTWHPAFVSRKSEYREQLLDDVKQARWRVVHGLLDRWPDDCIMCKTEPADIYDPNGVGYCHAHERFSRKWMDKRPKVLRLPLD